MAQAGAQITVFDGYGLAYGVVDPLERASAAGGDGNLIEAPMPGLVRALFAKAGQAVKAGERLAVLEAMKMEHSLLAIRDGVVAEVLVEEGAQVEAEGGTGAIGTGGLGWFQQGRNCHESGCL